MDLKQIEKLMIAMGRNGMKRFVIKREGIELELERDTGEKNQEPVFYDSRLFAGFSQERPIPTDPRDVAKDFSSDKVSELGDAQAGDFISSPLVGTFYSAPAPDAQPFVKPGDIISEDTIVCIVEAMKVMNEVKAGMSGRIVEVLLTNGDPVQFGSKLFRIVKAE
ncbi:acetyl-CoA carboxylase biotin carboxyl carrier protein [Chlamydia pecorum]|uniref:Biotin carboxyl carrier protein of acetyl-CoA carboxylase n=1 Tax=Chlamydia pecorum (strain ATCC VR-628 / DSM 29919 / E58) TaxID=331635 RepID=A0AA34WI91_CHLPE|nr:acetyl-CoA carboxylase biotin carboxyl carrier protein [Chlamydia pecorum]AEB41879.1 acetyl-CoA carboxylase, biotin carboxyl carrier protein [Chlamydia pecorum E58]AGW38970.1 acetyl-CoA carboxylase, biotin carboxyl carrier protein subunit [Chlamydia pecorum W73]AGW39896.1 acetyl-CoA carboxylase, biotin carboxyl carrier protein subunit [Chlamydia pecorum P787]ETF37062.1 acetyl-CoA carboxylase, biotin carboxyl carrier protein [Chlamydia pecorum MC/MarsBar]ETF37212.1 acetyl-CoA carboxylase, bi